MAKLLTMSENIEKDTAPQSAPDSRPAGLNKSQLAVTVQTLQFAWFVGHVFTLIGVFFFTLSYVGLVARTKYFWYNLAVFGIVESFGILIFQLIRKSGVSKNLLKDDNVHYLLLGFLFLVIRPYILLPILPFQLFSLFHVLSYTKSYLLPVFGHNETSSLSKSISSFINSNNQKSIQLATLLEFGSLVYLFVRVLLFRKRSLVPFAIYTVFIKLRSEKSALIRNYFHVVGAKIDGVAEGLNNANVKGVWSTVKTFFAKVNDFVLVNDWRKEKVN